ncbi:MAG: HAMP domain-containing histidine kinase [candidate division KSB1 bacterium]|nr:HAMP domain-containing histidine kinase [candidate division KSB1 bacterium]
MSEQREKISNSLSTAELLHLTEIVAHKIKNPLHSVGLNLDVLKTKIKKRILENPEDILKHADIIGAEFQRLNDIVHTFIDYLKPAAQSQTLIKVPDLLKEVYQTLKLKMAQPKVVVQVDSSSRLPSIRVNKEEIHQALVNIALNGIEAMSHGGKLVIRAKADKDKVFIEVVDSGPGIAEGERDKIFDLYYTTRKGRIGMGLPLARRWVEANGGRINVKCQEGHGSIFTMVFPVARE